MQIQRPVPRTEFIKIVRKSLNMKISPTVLDIIFYVFADSEGNLDGPGFVNVMKRRNTVPGYKVRCCSIRYISYVGWGRFLAKGNGETLAFSLH